MKNLTKLSVIVALVGSGYYAYSHLIAAPKEAEQKKAAQTVPVEVAKVRVGEQVVTLNTVGTLRANESLIIRPEIAGRIDSIHFTEGTSVTKATPLVSIDDRVYAAELKQAEATYKLAQVNFSRAKLLKEKGAGTVSNYDMSAANLASTQAQVELAKAKLDKTKLVAPFDGKVGLRKVSPGDYVNVGQDIVGFQSMSPMKADFTLPENAASHVSADQPIQLSVDAFPGREFSGRVYAVDPRIDEQNRSILLRAEIPNDDGELQAGFFARISLIVDRIPHAIFVPEQALMPSGNTNSVYLVGEDKKVKRQPVQVGERRAGEVHITEGLKEGDLVLTAGHLKVKDGGSVSFTLPGDAK